MTKAQIKQRLKILLTLYRRVGLKNKNFSILSNNRWDSAVYDRYHLPYKSPMIGLWMTAEDYLRFLGNLSFYLSQDMQQINWRESHCKELVQARKERGRYSFDLDELIIGRIYDVDIVFIHSHSFEETREKWNRRKKRIDFGNLLVKFNEQNDFENRPFKNKLFITAHKEAFQRSRCCFLDIPDWDINIKGDPSLLSKLPFDLKKFLNKICEEDYELKNIRGRVLPFPNKVHALAC